MVHPHNLEAERALLGGLLQEPSKVEELADRLRPEAFFRPDHAALYELLVRMHRSQQAIDLITLPQRLEREGLAERCGGLPYVLQLPDHAPSVANLDHYADVIAEHAGLRQLIRAAEELQRRAFGSVDSVSVLIERSIKELSEVGHGGRSQAWGEISLLVDEEIRRMEDAAAGIEDGRSVYTGFVDLDEALGGLRGGQLIVLAARPGMGKTALALNMAQNASLSPELPGVAVFSLEMTRHELVSRMLTSLSQLNARRVREGDLSEQEWGILVEASDDIRQTRIFIDDTPALSIGEVRARTRKLKAECPELSMVVVDYLQLMRGDDPRAPRIQQVGEISQGLKALAKDVGVPVIALSQLNRGVESRQDKRPVLSDLRESGAIEQDADIILFIYRDDYYDKESPNPGEAEVIIAKQRAGKTGTVKLVWRGAQQRFDSLIAEPDPLQ